MSESDHRERKHIRSRISKVTEMGVLEILRPGLKWQEIICFRRGNRFHELEGDKSIKLYLENHI